MANACCGVKSTPRKEELSVPALPAGTGVLRGVAALSLSPAAAPEEEGALEWAGLQGHTAEDG